MANENTPTGAVGDFADGPGSYEDPPVELTEQQVPEPAQPQEPEPETQPEPEPDKSPSPKTEYIILKVTEPSERGFGFPALEVVNDADENDRPKPVSGYSNKQAVRALLEEKDWLNDDDQGVGKFIAVPLRSFVTIERKIEKITNDVMELGQF